VAYKISRVDVWVVDLMNRPGMLARVLEALSNAGASLELVVARRATANTCRTFVAPLKGARQLRAATEIGLVRASGMYTLRIEGPDRVGLGALLTRKLADAGLNLRGLSAASLAKKSVTYIAFHGADDAQAAAKILKKALAK
jgi:hypothetical protein